MNTTANPAMALAVRLVDTLAHGGIAATIKPAYRGNVLIVSGSRAVWIAINDTDTILSACTANEVFTGPQATFRATGIDVLTAVAAAYLA